MTDRRARRRRAVLVGATVFLVGFAVRFAPMGWSQLPGTLDGITHAGVAERTLAGGQYDFPMYWDQVGFVTLLASVSALSGVPPLYVAQSMTAVLGGAACLVGAAVARRIALDLDWGSRRVDVATLVAGLLLAVEGLFVRRTGVPDEELVGLLLVPVFALAVHYAFRSRRPAWFAVAVVLLVVFPPLHSLSTLVAGVTATVVAAVDLRYRFSRRAAVYAVVLVGGLWLYVGRYYLYALSTPWLELRYAGRLLEAPGLFLAWGLLGVFAAFLLASHAEDSGTGGGAGAGTRSRRSRIALAVAFAVMFGLLAVNAVVPVFPGTILTQPVVLGLTLLLVVPAAFAVGGVALPTRTRQGALFLGLLVGPVCLVGYALTADVTFEFFDMAIRTQSFLHVAVMVAAALGAAALIGPRTASETARDAAAAAVAANPPHRDRGVRPGDGPASVAVGRVAFTDAEAVHFPHVGAVRPHTPDLEDGPAVGSEAESAATATGDGPDDAGAADSSGTRTRQLLARWLLRRRRRRGGSDDRRQGFSLPGVARVALVVLLVVAVVATVPLAFVELDTLAFSPTTMESEFGAAEYATTSLSGQWTTEHPMAAMSARYHAPRASGQAAPVRLPPTADWLRGGAPPSCPVLARQAWTTSGANLFPLPAERLSEERYDEWQAANEVVYSVDGADRHVIVVPRSSNDAGC